VAPGLIEALELVVDDVTGTWPFGAVEGTGDVELEQAVVGDAGQGP
jgi:hypothetical protein